MKISVISTGNMGSAVATGLMHAGHRVTVHNRARSKADALASHGAKLVDTAAQAITGSDYTTRCMR